MQSTFGNVASKELKISRNPKKLRNHDFFFHGHRCTIHLHSRKSPCYYKTFLREKERKPSRKEYMQGPRAQVQTGGGILYLIIYVDEIEICII